MKQKTVLITGATRGLGARITQHFWRLGANLILVARDASKLLALRTTLLASAGSQQKINVIQTDLACADAVTKLTEQLNCVDILINNAAIQGPIGPAWENDWEKWQTTLQVNLLSPVALCRAVLPHMMQNNYGKMINISGGGATQARPQFSAYATAKSGLVRFSETLAEEVKSFHIDVNCLAPGVMNTDMLNEIAKTSVDDTSLEQAAELCVFLASSVCDGVTGKLISAIWDPWKKLPDYIHDIKNSDVYTLRRIVPKDRGMQWGEK